MYCLYDRGSVLNQSEGPIGKTYGLAALFFSFALSNRCLGGVGDGAVHGHQPVAGIFYMRGHGIACNDLGVCLGGPVLVNHAQPLLDCAGKIGRNEYRVRLAGIGVANAQQRLVALGVERIGIDHGFQPGDGRDKVLAAIVKEADLGLPFGQYLLHVAQLLLGARHQRRVRKGIDHVPVLLLGALCVQVIAVGFLHLLVEDVGHLHLRFSRLWGLGEEGDEVLVLGLGLGKGRGAALPKPTVAHRQLGAHPVLRLRIRIEHRLEVEPGHVIAALLHGDHGLVEEFLVGLLGIDASQRVGAQVFLFLLVRGLPDRSFGRSPAQNQNRQGHRGNLLGQQVHNPSLRQGPTDRSSA